MKPKLHAAREPYDWQHYPIAIELGAVEDLLRALGDALYLAGERDAAISALESAYEQLAGCGASRRRDEAASACKAACGWGSRTDLGRLPHRELDPGTRTIDTEVMACLQATPEG